MFKCSNDSKHIFFINKRVRNHIYIFIALLVRFHMADLDACTVSFEIDNLCIAIALRNKAQIHARAHNGDYHLIG